MKLPQSDVLKAAIKANALKWISERFEIPPVWVQGTALMASMCPFALMLQRGDYEKVEVYATRVTYQSDGEKIIVRMPKRITLFVRLFDAGAFAELELGPGRTPIHEAGLIDAEWMERAIIDNRIKELISSETGS